MKFGEVPLDEAEGAILAHAVRVKDVALKKGDMITRARRLMLAEAGVKSIVAARLEEGDVSENEAARELAKRLAGAKVRSAAAFTGRVNLFAEAAGLAVVDAAAIDRINAIDESVTVATLPNCRPVADGDMIATVKIIPFATHGATLKAAFAALGGGGAVSVAAFRPLRIAVVSTLLPGLKPSVVAKTLKALEARLAPTGARIVAQETAPHEIGALADAMARLAPGADALIIFGASAIIDRRDVIPAAIEAFGGRIERFGMPVDPGNLLLLAARGDMPILGAPAAHVRPRRTASTGCFSASSPACRRLSWTSAPWASEGF